MKGLFVPVSELNVFAVSLTKCPNSSLEDDPEKQSSDMGSLNMILLGIILMFTVETRALAAAEDCCCSKSACSSFPSITPSDDTRSRDLVSETMVFNRLTGFCLGIFGLGDGLFAYEQARLLRLQPRHIGLRSSHFLRRYLQDMHPVLLRRIIISLMQQLLVSQLLSRGLLSRERR